MPVAHKGEWRPKRAASNNKTTKKNITRSAVSVYIKPRPPPTLEKNTHGSFADGEFVVVDLPSKTAARPLLGLIR